MAARAEPAVVDRRFGIAVKLHRAAFAHLHADAAARRALAAGGGVPCGVARDLILRPDQVGDQLFGRLGADAARRGDGGGAARHPEDLEEASPVAPVRQTVSRAANSDSPCSTA